MGKFNLPSSKYKTLILWQFVNILQHKESSEPTETELVWENTGSRFCQHMAQILRWRFRHKTLKKTQEFSNVNWLWGNDEIPSPVAVFDLPWIN